MILTGTEGQHDLPRYFAPAFRMAQGLNRGRLDVVLPDGRRFRAEGAHPGHVAEIHVHNPDLFARLIREGDMGFSEAYLEGWWSSPDLQAFMDLINDGNPSVYDEVLPMGLVRAYERLRHWLRSNSKGQARRNIAHHYDLGNDFYRLWLDDTMTYSSALFRTGQESLERAQEQKYAALLDRLAVKPGDHVLEIGCGWGGFAEYAARERGLRVTGLTISQAQHDYAVARMAAAGVSDRVEIVLRDYRDERGSYDGVASIEMFEAVGERYWPAYFRTLHDRLRPGARAALQVITVPDDRFEAYRRHVDFIQKYIFPGGMLGAVAPLRRQAAQVGLTLVDSFGFAESYSQTLRRWNDRFNEQWDQIAALGYDERFRRMWEYYLTSCAGAFQSGNCDVVHMTLRRPG
ncbi:MAG: class I SAM-dependent methyltransferase [Rhodobacteraceae bacterium]|nr:class I SAM-dependent methyltransferase [Paracoccaceae bacterium]MCC6009163.1 class I SAM-dependent methyltransferase [Paracoccaceae bacterium]